MYQYYIPWQLVLLWFSPTYSCPAPGGFFIMHITCSGLCERYKEHRAEICFFLLLIAAPLTWGVEFHVMGIYIATMKASIERKAV